MPEYDTNEIAPRLQSAYRPGPNTAAWFQHNMHQELYDQYVY